MKKRLISAVVALVISVPLIYIGGNLFYLFAILISLIGFREILNLITKDYTTKIFNYIIFLSIIGFNLYKTDFNNIIRPNFIGIIFIIFALITLLRNKESNFSKSFCLMGINLFLSVSFSSLIITRNISLQHFLYILILPFMNDTFAYITGSLIGKHKMTDISPKKSWEGSIGGIIFGTLISSLFYLVFIDYKVNLILLIIIGMILSIIGQLGDLFFSLIKRNYKIKDYSNLMPGHGGVLDRIDSVIFVTLAFTYFITLL